MANNWQTHVGVFADYPLLCEVRHRARGDCPALGQATSPPLWVVGGVGLAAVVTAAPDGTGGAAGLVASIVKSTRASSEIWSVIRAKLSRPQLPAKLRVRADETSQHLDRRSKASRPA
jgi:hypothetical protein